MEGGAVQRANSREAFLGLQTHPPPKRAMQNISNDLRVGNNTKNDHKRPKVDTNYFAQRLTQT